MTAKVYFANLRTRSKEDNKTNKVLRLFEAAGFSDIFSGKRLTAIKMHFGEMGNDTFLSPVFVRALVERLNQLGTSPFVTDSNTLYAGSRHNAVDHLKTALAHGFSYATINAPLIIADGLRGESCVEQAIEGKHFKRVKLAGAIAKAEAMLVLSHFKGHPLGGFGGATKNLAMGCTSGDGKREQHSPRFEINQDVCAGCGECEEVCPAGAARVEDGKASIDKDACIGCGDCYAHCREGAVTIDWKTEVPKFVERMTEYAHGANLNKKGAVGYINFLMNITPDCDCLPWSDAPIVPDIGIMASTDPLALDKASYDLVNQCQGFENTHLSRHHQSGEDKFKGVWDYTQGDIIFSYGKELGLGETEYELVDIGSAAEC